MAARQTSEAASPTSKEPRCIQVAVQWNIGGKVAIKEYGKITSNYGASMSRTYEIPEGMTEEEVDAFQIVKRQHLQELLEPVDQENFDERYAQRDWND